MDLPRRRGELIKSLEEVLAISEELNDSDTGYLMGWDIKKERETICSDPYVGVDQKEIECD